ncbi:protein ALTERED PHOSPHATE STARVATION RESPONSE 1-like [Phoenix dactylifera]|uniref:Protein ALTERED PHOSPHATE STARVATION RESPONSE 1-like n=1 Tax=Phoenix dactylifera TaxID=42345 RepID=A0A8B9B1T7_PHODC|nr:protein ALTERED PHOSPHATE STARVATION RESPONSE 1-like [Phoenix dactylifera]
MGCSGSKPDRNKALTLCKERMQYIKQAIDSRYALSAAQLSYVRSLHNMGAALRQFVEAEILIKPSLASSEPDKSPSISSHASPSPSHIAEHVASPSHSSSPFSPRVSSISYMKAAAGSSMKVTVKSSCHFVDEESLTFPFPPPPPPEIGSSWDFFDPVDSLNKVGVQNGEHDITLDISRLMGLRQSKEEDMAPSIEEEAKFSRADEEMKWNGDNSERNSAIYLNSTSRKFDGGGRVMDHPHLVNGTGLEESADLAQKQICNGRGLKSDCSYVNGSAEALSGIASSELHSSKREKANLQEEPSRERKDASEFITRRAKDFLSSIKDIELYFTRAAESGHEISRMLETNKIRLSICSETIGKSSASLFLSAFLICCRAGNVSEHESAQLATKVITWSRTVSSRSSSSRNPLVSAPKDDTAESGSDFIEEFCMISGSHSSTLDRLFAWERKLYNEVKASESIRKVYDQKCNQLRHQFARDMNAQVIDKTRAAVKDLHSRVRVSIQAVESISRRIEKLRDEELQPQLIELVQGLIRMWRAMLENHHAQYIIISLAYHVKSPTAALQNEFYREALMHLRHEIICFQSSFVHWVDAHKSYVEALNTWIQKCILLPQERASRGRKVTFSPRRALAPPIVVLLRDWLAGIQTLPPAEVCDSIKSMASDLHSFFEQPIEERQAERRDEEVEIERKSELRENKGEEKCERDSKLCSFQTSLTRSFDRLTKFSEAIVKIYEDVKRENETARNAYADGRIR